MIISHFPSGGSGGLVPEFTYTGSYDLVAEPEGWKIRFLSSGTFTPKSNVTVDIFCVGGGGNGSNYIETYSQPSYPDIISNSYGAGGGAGYTKTEASKSLTAYTSYAIVVGSAGTASSFGSICSANGGNDATNAIGGNGGSGAASGGVYSAYQNGNYYSGKKKITGGSNGNDGEDYFEGAIDWNGIGQHTTTKEFGESSGALYASGGSAYGKWGNPAAPAANTGNGGNGTSTGSTAGASGIVIIRNARA